MAGVMTQAGLDKCAEKFRAYCVTVAQGVSVGPCANDGTYIGVAAAGYQMDVDPYVSGDIVSFDCDPDVQTVIKSDATYQFRKLEVRHNNAAFSSGGLIMTLARSADLQFDYGGKIILQELSVEFSI